MLKNTYPCAAVILERAWGSEKGKSIDVFGQKQTLEKTAATCSNRTLKLFLRNRVASKNNMLIKSAGKSFALCIQTGA